MTKATDAMQRVLARFPDAKLTVEPTPIYRLQRLSGCTGHNIYIMRDDLTGFAIGGNKVRKLDFLIADALARKADTLLTSKASNFSRNAAAAASVFGLDIHVIVAGTEAGQNNASQALFKQFGARLHYCGALEEAAMSVTYARTLASLKSDGKNVYELHPGGSDAIGSLGYLKAFDQIVRYSVSTGIHFNRIIHSTGSAATQVGLILGQTISGYDTAIIGMAAAQPANRQTAKIRDLLVSTAEMLGTDVARSRIIVDDRFVGPGYAVPSAAGIAASALFATKEGVLLDDVYSGKAAAGLMSYVETGRLDEQGNVLFIHTGGNGGQYY